MLLLVRHAMPDASPEVPSGEWPLTPAGRAAASSLVDALPAGALLVASDERKAWETLGAGSVPRDPRFGEVRRDEGWSDDFRTVRGRYVAGEALPGWEPQADVVARFGAGLDSWRARADGALVVATHGMAMTVWLVSVGRVPVGEAEAFWSGLGFPDVVRVD